MSPAATGPTTGPNGHPTGRLDDIEVSATVAKVLGSWPSAGLAVGIVRDDSLALAMRRHMLGRRLAEHPPTHADGNSGR